MGLLMGYKIEKIEIYPYGGCTKLNCDLNTSIFKEFLVLVSGPLLQIIFYIFIKKFLNINDYLIFKRYNYQLLCFNLLPIYPLDGGRLLNLILCIFFSYKKCLRYSIFISFFVIGICLIYVESLSFFLVLSFLIVKIIDEKSKINYYYNKFLLERYLKKYTFKKTKIINNVNELYRSCNHLIKYNNRYFYEKDILEYRCKLNN